ncbi:4Fe-4S dicluster domain-containing protein [Anaerobranca californiensis DSM 14826]|uniref:Ferredoxin n=1 Tax=Anaerobranca californiensis DSM 14826 TaxID=1120989 RepID=A0A1M6LK76_9FIRM|nr:4Fe-4S binding protein [Anaerobranca californiensis]SHJ71593.1 4Fe-4S dicluster domain-containing protein [Anaerobranca californiensis DSM 14826]
MLFRYIIKQLTKVNVPVLKKESCISFRNNKNKCNRCLEVCPNSCIEIDNNGIELDEDLCLGCGICTTVCPSQSLYSKGEKEEQLLSRVEELPKIVLGCEEKNDGNLKVPCLNGLHRELLTAIFILLKDKEIYFNVSGCENCQVQKDYKIFKENLEAAQKFLSNFNLKSNINLITNTKDVPQQVLELSRRDFMVMLKEQTKEKTLEVLKKKNNSKTPYHRKIFLEELKGLKVENIVLDKENSLLQGWNVTENCDGCGFCQAICPNKAWKLEKNKLSFNISQCTNCRLCVELCPQKSIISADLVLSEIDGYRIKKEFNIKVCRKCGKEFIEKGLEEFCLTCKKRANLLKANTNG